MAVANLPCLYIFTKVAMCLPGVRYLPYYWYTRCCIGNNHIKNWILSTLKDIYFYMTSEYQVPPASVPLAEPGQVDDPHLLGLDPGLPGHSGAVLQCRQSGGQEVDGDEAGEY